LVCILVSNPSNPHPCGVGIIKGYQRDALIFTVV
jgi:hypothetical protein